jgi:hypothetical protein
MSEDDSITFRIYPDAHTTPGHAVLIVSYLDWERMKGMKWNMEKPDETFYKENRIVFFKLLKASD